MGSGSGLIEIFMSRCLLKKMTYEESSKNVSVTVTIASKRKVPTKSDVANVNSTPSNKAVTSIFSCARVDRVKTMKRRFFFHNLPVG